MSDDITCKICKQVITDTDGAIPFVVGNVTRFMMHPACRGKLVASGALIGTTLRSLVDLRNPGLLDAPAVRGFIAMVRELRK
jgi:hypothetical protein